MKHNNGDDARTFHVPDGDVHTPVLERLLALAFLDTNTEIVVAGRGDDHIIYLVKEIFEDIHRRLLRDIRFPSTYTVHPSEERCHRRASSSGSYPRRERL